MANVVITKSGSSIIVDFGVYTASETRVDMIKSSFHAGNLCEAHLYSDHVLVHMSAIPDTWRITYDSTYAGAEYFIVDSVEGVAPTSESDLFDKIASLRG